MSISNPDHFPRQLTVIIVNCHGAPCRAQRRPSVTRMETCRAHHAHLIRFSSLTEPQIRIQSHPRISVRPILSPHRRCDAHACSPGTRRRTSFCLLQAPTRSDISTTGRQTRLIWSTRFTVHHVKFLPVCSLNCRLFRTHVGCLFLATCHRYLYLNRKYYYVG